MYSYFSRCHVTPNNIAPLPLYKLHTTHNSSIRSDEGLTLETSAFRISVRWSIYIFNSVDKTNFLYTTPPPTQHHSFFRNYPLYLCGLTFGIAKSTAIGVYKDVIQALCQLKDQFIKFANSPASMREKSRGFR